MEKINQRINYPLDRIEMAAVMDANIRYAAKHLRTGNDPADRGKPRSSTTEPQVAMVMVQPVLNLIGYGGRADPDSLQRELVLIRGERADFACLHDNEVVLTVECKNLGVDLRNEEIVFQACKYAMAAGIQYAMLTDGVVWALYDTHAKGRVLEKLVLKIDLRKDAVPRVIDFFLSVSRAKAADGALSVKSGLPTSAKSKMKSRARRRARKHGRMTLGSPKMKNHMDRLSARFGGSRLVPMENARNAFVTEGRERIRICVSAASKGLPMFNFREGHLNADWIVLMTVSDDGLWVVPCDEIRAFMGILEGSAEATVTPRVSRENGIDRLFTNKLLRGPLDISRFRVAA